MFCKCTECRELIDPDDLIYYHERRYCPWCGAEDPLIVAGMDVNREHEDYQRLLRASA